MTKAKTISAYDFMMQFPDEASAYNHLEKIRWAGERECPHCKTKDRSTPTKGRAGFYRCKDCRKHFTVRTGTIFERSHMDLKKWFFTIYLLQTAHKGISALRLSKEIGVQYKTAWFMLHRLREACDIRAIKLTGIVEIDETYICGKERHKHKNKRNGGGRGSTGKQAVFGMREHCGRTVAKPIPSTSKATMHNEIGHTIEFDSTIYTDEHPSYDQLKTGCKHESVRHSAKEYVNGLATNGIESVWAVLKRGYNGVYHNWSTKHLHRYVNEFTFRLSAGNVRTDTIDRINKLIRQSVGKRLTYAQLTWAGVSDDSSKA